MYAAIVVGALLRRRIDGHALGPSGLPDGCAVEDLTTHTGHVTGVTGRTETGVNGGNSSGPPRPRS
jgi:hypothetical protein